MSSKKRLYPTTTRRGGGGNKYLTWRRERGLFKLEARSGRKLTKEKMHFSNMKKEQNMKKRKGGIFSGKSFLFYFINSQNCICDIYQGESEVGD